MSSVLLKEISHDYAETTPLYYHYVPHHRIPPFRVHWHVPRMQSDETVQIGLWAIKGHMLSLAKVFVDTTPMPDEVQDSVKNFLIAQLNRWWIQSILCQMTALDYGYFGAEVMYDIDENGMLCFSALKPFLQRDVSAVIHHNRVVGLLYRSAGRAEPGYLGGRKKLWGVHSKDISQFYGRSRCYGSYKSWVKKVMDRGAEDQTVHYFYRYGFGGDVIRFPEEVVTLREGLRVHARTIAMDMLEKLSSGGSIGLPSTVDPITGKDKWELQTREVPGSAESVLAWMDHLDEKILRGMGVTRELLEEPQTGSLAGRRVSESAFHGMLIQIFIELLCDFDYQVLKPLVKGNFGVNPNYNLIPMGFMQRFDLNQTFGSMSGQDADPSAVDSSPLKGVRAQTGRVDNAKENV